MGDTDARLHRVDPGLMHEFLLATQHSGTAIMLLHCYPYHRQAACLANVFPHVYLDVGEALNHVGASSAAVLAEALEVAPFHKQLYSSDAYGLAELHYLGAAGFRRDLARVIGAFVADGAWSAADGEHGGPAHRLREQPPGVPAGRPRAGAARDRDRTRRRAWTPPLGAGIARELDDAIALPPRAARRGRPVRGRGAHRGRVAAALGEPDAPVVAGTGR